MLPGPCNGEKNESSGLVCVEIFKLRLHGWQGKTLTAQSFIRNVIPVFIRAAIEAMLQTFLILSIVVVYGVGSVAGVEFEHDHGGDHAVESTEAPDDHHHHHHDHDDHHHDDHNGGEDELGGETPDDEEGSSSHHHSHVVSFDTQVATNLVNLQRSEAGIFSNERLIPEKDLCPDGPFYELSKPPQLG